MGDLLPPETIPAYIAEVANTSAIPLPAVGSRYTSLYFDAALTHAPIVTLCLPVFGENSENSDDLRGALNADIPLAYSHDIIDTTTYLTDGTVADVYSMLITGEGIVVDGSNGLLYKLFCSNSPNAAGCNTAQQYFNITSLQSQLINTYLQEATGLPSAQSADLITLFQTLRSGTSTVNLTSTPYYIAYQMVDTVHLDWIAVSFARQALVDSQAVLQLTLDSSDITTEQVGTLVTGVKLINSGTLPVTYSLTSTQAGFNLLNTTSYQTFTADIAPASTIHLPLELDTLQFGIGTQSLPLSVTYSDSKYLCVDRYQSVQQSMIILAPFFQYSSGVRSGVLFILILTMCVTLFICAWTLWQRQHEVVKRASPNLIGVTCCGGIFLVIACMIQYPTQATLFSCNGTIWFGHIGFTLLFAPLVLKTWRINRIFNVAQLHVTKISDRMLFRLLGLFLLPPVALLTAWSIQSTPTSLLTNNGSTRFYACHSDSGIYKFILLATEFTVLLYTVILCFQIRKSPDQFNEGRLLGAIVYNSTVVGAIAVGVLLAFTTLSPDIEYIVVSFGISLVVNATLLILMVPKLIEVHYSTRVADIHTSYKLNQQKSSPGHSEQVPSPGMLTHNLNQNNTGSDALFVRTPAGVVTPQTQPRSQPTIVDMRRATHAQVSG